MIKVATVVLWVAAVAALFLLLHPASCVSTGAGTPDGTSLWPPGTKCAGGEPEHVTVVLNPAFIFAAAAVSVAAFAVLRLASRPGG